MSPWVSIDTVLEADEERRWHRCPICRLGFEEERDCAEHAKTHEPCSHDGCTYPAGHGRWHSTHAPSRSQCNRGHAFTPENTYQSVDARGHTHRRCKQCNTERNEGRKR